MLGDLNESGLAAVADELRAGGAEVACLATDLSERTQVEALVQSAITGCAYLSRRGAMFLEGRGRRS